MTNIKGRVQRIEKIISPKKVAVFFIDFGEAHGRAWCGNQSQFWEGLNKEELAALVAEL